MFRFLVVFLLLALATAFAPTSPQRWGVVSNTKLAMFSGDNPKGLEEVEDPKTAVMMETTTTSSEPTVAPRKAVYKNLARGGEVTEVPWVDTEMAANTRPWEMSWWAYLLWGLPVTLLANDFLHFLPKDGPLGFLSTL